MINNAEQTVVDSYTLVYEHTGSNETAPTTFPFGVSSGDIDLLNRVNGGAGNETKAYRLELLFTAKPAGTATVIITGASEGGPEEYICSLALSSAGDIVETGDWRIVDTITLSSFHLARCSTVVADSGNDRPCKLGFDAIGYRYINFYTTAKTTTTDLRIYARHF